MNGGTISGNSATFHGGGVYSSSAIFTMNGGTISGNSAVDGGGLYNILSSLYIGGTSQIIENKATTGFGGGIFSSESSSDDTFDGPNVAVKSNTAHLPDTLPAGTSWYQQYGVYMYSGSPATTNGFVPGTQVTGNTHI
jgi:hypothetical protein